MKEFSPPREQDPKNCLTVEKARLGPMKDNSPNVCSYDFILSTAIFVAMNQETSKLTRRKGMSHSVNPGDTSRIF